MKVLHTGRGTSGSWQCRGIQLGHAVPKAGRKVIAQADAVVLVKRPYAGFLDAVRAARRPWVWDVVDAYPQPQCTSWGRSRAIHWFKTQLRNLNPDGVIFPNQRMADDCATNVLSTVIYHHHRIDMPVNPIRERVVTVGYEGSPKYLGKWGDALIRECRRRGWNFSVNQGCHADFDICVAFRDEPYNGYAQRHWKSNVKLANCHGSGTPFIGPRECGYVETQSGMEEWVECPGELAKALERLASVEHRQDVHAAFLRHALSVEECKSQLRSFLESL